MAWLFLLLGSLALAAPAIPEDCRARFAQLVKHPAPLGPETPALTFPTDTRSVEASFRLAENAWQSRVNVDRLRRLLTRIESVPLDAEDFLARLKEDRKWASILRSHYAFLSRDQKPPPVFDEFTKLLGKLNDGIELRLRPKDLSELAGRARNALNRLDLEPNAFRPARSADIRHRVRQISGAIDQVLESEITTPHELHEVRKQLKELLAYQHALAALEPTLARNNQYSFLHSLNEELGRLNDQYVAGAHLGTVDYDSERIFLHPLLRERLQKALQALGP